jgi:hypothetical protein
VSYVLKRTIALHAGYIRRRWATEQAVVQSEEN